MEAEIERKGLVEPYMLALREVADSMAANPVLWWWAIAHASPEQRVRAALKAIPAKLAV
jgi:hypothetical protein